MAIPFAGRLEVLGLRLSPEGSPTSETESSLTFCCLRAGCSLPAAPHPASQRRSCFQLRRVSSPPVGTFTQLLECARGRTRGACAKRLSSWALDTDAPAARPLRLYNFLNCLAKDLVLNKCVHGDAVAERA
jgi:hypothetical protein